MPASMTSRLRETWLLAACSARMRRRTALPIPRPAQLQARTHGAGLQGFG